MQIAIDAGPLYGHVTGVGRAADGIIAALGALTGDEAVVLAPYLVSARSTPRPGHRRLPIPGIVASHLWSRAEHPRADRWLDGADVVHGTNYVAPPTALPTVVTVYDCWFLRHPELADPLVRRAGRNLRRAVARGAWVHATSDAGAADVRELLDTDRVATVMLGAPNEPARIDRTPALLTDLAGRRFVLAIGTEERRKGLTLLIDAFDRLAGDREEVHLVLAGAPGDDTDTVVERIRSTTHASRIRRLGRIDDTTKDWLLRHASALAYPSLDEGFGFPVLEAQLAGVPVVATAVGSIPEVAGEAAQLVHDRDPDSFAAALDGVLAGVGRLALVEAGYRNAARFSWSATARGLVDLYRAAVES